jgi:hypothetical protein
LTAVKEIAALQVQNRQRFTPKYFYRDLRGARFFLSAIPGSWRLHRLCISKKTFPRHGLR